MTTIQPEQIAAKLKEAEIYQSQGLFDDAISIYEQVLVYYDTFAKKHWESLTPALQSKLEQKITQLRVRIQSLQKIRMDTYKYEDSTFHELKPIIDTFLSIGKTVSDATADPTKTVLKETKSDKKLTHDHQKHPVAARLLSLVFSYNLFFIVLSIAIAFAFILKIPAVRMVEDVDHFVLPNDPDNLFYEQFKETFGNDEFFIVSFSKDNIFQPQHLELIKDITYSLSDIEEIREVESLANADLIVGGEDFFEVREFIEEIPEDADTLDNMKIQATTNPLYVNNFISADASTAAIVISAYERPGDEYYRERLMRKVKTVLNEYSDRVDHFFLAGKTVTDTTMSEYMKADMELLVPISYLLITLTILFFYKNINLIFLAVLNISVCLACTMGFFGWSGITQNSVTSIVIPLVMALSLCDTVHIFSHLDKGLLLSDQSDRKKILLSALSPIVLPCFLTTLTTIVGFLSLSVSHLLPIREFAVTASVGLFFEFFFSFFLLAPLLLLWKPEKLFQDFREGSSLSLTLKRLIFFIYNYGKWLLLLFLAIVAISLFLSKDIQIETNVIEFFKSKSLIRNDLIYVEKMLGGVESLDIAFQSESTGDLKNPEALRTIEKIQKSINVIPGVDVTLSFVDFIKDMNRAFHREDDIYYTIPDSRELIAQYLLLYDADDIEDFVNYDFDQARISIRVSEHSSGAQKRIINEIKTILDSYSMSYMKPVLTGRVLQDVNVIDDIFRSQVYSLLLATGTIALIMFFILRSIKLGLISLFPNIFPLIFNYGIMGISGIPLNTATALIGAVAIGIAVDDTVHIMSELRRQLASRQNMADAVNHSIHSKGRAIITSSVILSCGFGVLGFSKFVPTIYFGILCSGIMISAVIGDLVLLPSILLLRGTCSQSNRLNQRN